MCQVHWLELFKSSKWRVFKIESDHLELVNGERGDFQESFVGNYSFNPEWDRCTRDSGLIKFRALVWPTIICNLHPYHSHKRNDENHFLNLYMAMGHENACGLKSGRSAAPFIKYNQERIILFSFGAVKYPCPTRLKFLKVKKTIH